MSELRTLEYCHGENGVEMTTASKDEIVEASEVRSTDKRAIFYLEWALETEKHNLVLANDLLRLFVTLSLGSLGLGVSLLRGQVHGIMFMLTSGSFMGALAAAMTGAMPYSSLVGMSSRKIAEHKEKALNSKRFWLWISFGLLVLGYLLAIGGLAPRIFL